MADITLDNMTTLNADKLSRRFPIIGWHTDQQISWQDKHDKSTWQINVSSAHLSVCQRHDHAPTHHETCRQLRQLLPSAWLCLPPMTQINVSWQRQKSDADRSDESHARLRQRHKTLRRKPCKTEVSQSATQDATTKAMQDPKCRRQRHKTLRRKPCKTQAGTQDAMVTANVYIIDNNIINKLQDPHKSTQFCIQNSKIQKYFPIPTDCKFAYLCSISTLNKLEHWGKLFHKQFQLLPDWQETISTACFQYWTRSATCNIYMQRVNKNMLHHINACRRLMLATFTSTSCIYFLNSFTNFNHK